MTPTKPPLLTAAILVTVIAMSTPASAEHVPCFSDYDHGTRFECAPDASDPLCVEWYFEFGVAYVCPRDHLP